MVIVKMAGANTSLDSWSSDEDNIAAAARRDSRSPSPDSSSNAIKELLASIITDWTCIAAGVPSPLSENSVEHFKVQLDKPIDVSAAPPTTAGAEKDDAVIACPPPSKRRRRAGNTPAEQGLLVGLHAGGAAGANSTPASVACGSRQRSEPRPRKRRLVQPLSGLQVPFAYRQLPHVTASALQNWINQAGEATAFCESKLPPSRKVLGLDEAGVFLVENMARMEFQLMKPSTIPLSSQQGAGSASAIFLTQLFPKSWNALGRFQILDIFRLQAPYVPRCVVHSPNRPALFFYGAGRDDLDVAIQKWTQPLGARKVPAPPIEDPPPDLGPGAWPCDRLPPEICEAIAEHIHRDDIKSLRLVCKEFEQKFSVLFRSVVVPFSPELYTFDASTEQSSGRDSTPPRSVVVGQSDLKMFQERGWDIRRFAIAFDFNEDTLATPLSIVAKPKWSHSQHFYGEVVWPDITSTMRYDRMRELEATADQVQNMKAALGLLTNLGGLGLYLDNGFGWLNGPDQSDRARRARRPDPIFQPLFLPNEAVPVKRVPTLITGQEVALVSAIEMLHQYARVLQPLESYESRHLRLVAEYVRTTPVNRLPELDREAIKKHVNLFLQSKAIRVPTETHWMTVRELADRRKTDKATMHSNGANKTTILTAPELEEADQKFVDFLLLVGKDEPKASSSTDDTAQPKPRYDNFDLTVGEDEYEAFRGYYLSRLKHSLLKPGNLTQLQLRLLKENEWAQQAFLNTFMLSVIDNYTNMSNVRILNIAQLPGSQLCLLDRRDFWDGLPNVGDLTLFVSPEWRDVPFAPSYALDNHEERSVLPSLASERFGRFLVHRIQKKESLRSLRLGYVGGGERATGLFARNRNILPAPVLPANKNFDDVLLLPHVARLTFVNCWMPGAALLRFAERMGRHSLEHLRLESFSLLPFNGFSTLVDREVAPQLRNSDPIWIAGKRYTDFLVPCLTPADAQAFHMVNGESLNARVIKLIAPTEYLDKGPMPGTWSSLLYKLIPRTVPDATAPPTAADSASSLNAGGPGSPESIPLGLKTIELSSCGYAKLRNQTLCADFDVREDDANGHHGIGATGRMQDRRLALRPLMMQSPDVFLAQIVPKCIASEKTLLNVVYDLQTGWADRAKALQCCEDDQEEGGSGRYSGTVEAH